MLDEFLKKPIPERRMPPPVGAPDDAPPFERADPRDRAPAPPARRSRGSGSIIATIIRFAETFGGALALSFIGLVTWGGGVFFTYQIVLPIFGAQWAIGAALGAQLTLSAGQWVARHRGRNWGWMCFILDVGINLVGILIAFGLADSGREAVYAALDMAFGVREGMVLLVLSLAGSILIAFTPESFIAEAIAMAKGGAR